MGAQSYKILLVGDKGVGKTSMIRNFTEGTFSGIYSKTKSSENVPHKFEVRGEIRNTYLCSVAGFNCYSVPSSVFRDTDVFIVVFDGARVSSMNSVEMWKEKCEKEMMQDGTPFILVNNKCDVINSKLDHNSLKTVKENNHFNASWHTSAKTGENISQLFTTAAELAVDFQCDFQKKDEKTHSDVVAVETSAAGATEKNRKESFVKKHILCLKAM